MLEIFSILDLSCLRLNSRRYCFHSMIPKQILLNKELVY